MTADLADEVIEQAWVLGLFRAPPAVKERLRDRRGFSSPGPGWHERHIRLIHSVRRDGGVVYDRTVGFARYGRRELERMRRRGDRVHLDVVGLLVLEGDITPDFAAETFKAVRIMGWLRASKALRRELASKIIRR